MRPQSLLRLSQWILPGLLAVPYALCLWLLADVDQNTEPRAALVRDSLLFGQIALGVGWAILGPGRWFVRWPAAAQLLGLLSVTAHKHLDERLFNWTSWVARTDGAVLLAIFLVARLRGWTIAGIGFHEPPSESFRFSLASMIVWVAVVAVSVQAGQILRAAMFVAPTVPAFIAVGTVAIPFAILASISVWTFLKPGRWWWRLPAWLALAPALGLVPPVLCNKDADWRSFVAWTSGQAVCLGVSLLIVRGAGFRLLGKEGVGSRG